MLTDPTGEEVRAIVGDGEATYELRYAGQSHELAVKADPDTLRAAFEDVHESRYGYRDPDARLELVTIRVSEIVPGAEVTLHGTPGPAIAGPTVIELPEATLLVPEGWSAAVDDTGTTRLQR
jgi:N-methylhydantoinase A